MAFIEKGKTNWKFILLLVVLAVIVGSGIVTYTRYITGSISPI